LSVNALNARGRWVAARAALSPAGTRFAKQLGVPFQDNRSGNGLEESGSRASRRARSRGPG
jgi:hypothetical protein